MKFWTALEKAVNERVEIKSDKGGIYRWHDHNLAYLDRDKKTWHHVGDWDHLIGLEFEITGPRILEFTGYIRSAHIVNDTRECKIELLDVSQNYRQILDTVKMRRVKITFEEID